MIRLLLPLQLLLLLLQKLLRRKMVCRQHSADSQIRLIIQMTTRIFARFATMERSTLLLSLVSDFTAPFFFPSLSCIFIFARWSPRALYWVQQGVHWRWKQERV